MAVSISVGDILSVRAWNSLGDQAAVNTYNFACISLTGGAVTDQDFVTAVAIPMQSFYTQAQSTHSVYNGCQCYFLKRSGPLPFPVKDITGAGAGIQTGTPTPRVAAFILKYNTNLRGPEGRGRVYLPFVAAVFLDNTGDPTTAWNVLANGFASVLLTPITVTSGGSSATFTWSLVKRPAGGPVTATGQIISAESAQKIGQMHKRGDYGRANASPI